MTSGAFAPDGGRVLTASDDKTARSSGAATADSSSSCRVILARSAAQCLHQAVHRILTASWDGTARLWNGDGTLLFALLRSQGVVTSAVFAPDGDTILTASTDKTVRVWHHDGTLVAILQGHKGPIVSAVFSPTGAAS